MMATPYQDAYFAMLAGKTAPKPTLDSLLVDISEWVNGGITASTREALDLHRTMKVAEEAGEVIRAMTGWTGANRRKGVTHTREDVIDELLDTALAALCAVEHLSGHDGQAMFRLDRKARLVASRAGIEATR